MLRLTPYQLPAPAPPLVPALPPLQEKARASEMAAWEADKRRQAQLELQELQAAAQQQEQKLLARQQVGRLQAGCGAGLVCLSVGQVIRCSLRRGMPHWTVPAA